MNTSAHEVQVSTNLLLAVNNFLIKADAWKSIHESHLEGMRASAKNESTDLLASVKVFLARVDNEGWQIHESHLMPLRTFVTEAEL